MAHPQHLLCGEGEARRLTAGEVRNAPVTTRSVAWCTESRVRLLDSLALSYTKLA